MTQPPDLLTVKQLAKRLNLSPRTIHGLRLKGKIPVVNLGLRSLRFSYDEVVDALVALAEKRNETRTKRTKFGPPPKKGENDG